MQTETVIGILASVLTAVAMLPQLVRIIREKQAENGSLWVATILIFGVGCWIIYGILKDDLIILISNSFSLLINVLIVVLAINYNNR